MSEQPSFSVPSSQDEQTTHKYIITFAPDRLSEGLTILKKDAGISSLPSSDDFSESAVDFEQIENAGGGIFPKLGIAVVTLDNDALNSMMAVRSDDASILDIEPERIFYALNEESAFPVAYLKGYRDAVNDLFEKTIIQKSELKTELMSAYVDDAQSTWGLKATLIVNSRWTGRGIKIAVLDTGFDSSHPDFRGRVVTSRSFVQGETVQDGHGHGTHCIGSACGFKDERGRRYGAAYQASIFVGKVLNNTGSGTTSGIIAGMEWAVANRCELISMSLGNKETTPSTAYTTAGQRALQNGCLVVAAAGNHRQSVANPPGLVGQPANSPSILAVGAIDNQLELATFSCRSGSAAGANVDIVAPGVSVYSSTKMPGRYATWNGTSMATPHVAGIGALYAEAFGARGDQLWRMLISRARRLPIDSRDVGSGLVQAPS